VGPLNRRVGGLLQFFDRAPTEEIDKVEADAAALEREAGETLKSIDAEEQRLRAALAALRPVQPVRYASNHDWARNRFHIYWFNHYGNEPPGYDDSVRYMVEMGASALQEWAYRGQRRHGKWEDYVAEWRRRLDLLQRGNMRMFLMSHEVFPVHPHPNYVAQARENIEKYLATFGDHPAFGGIEFDEIHFGNCWCRICRPMFHEYLKTRFSRDEMVEIGLVKGKVEEVDQIAGPAQDERTANPGLHTVRMEWRAHVFEQAARSAFDRLRELRPDALAHVLLSPANFTSFTNRDWGGPFGAPLYRMAALADMITIDPYWNGVPEEAYWCDMMRAHARGPALLTVGTHYGGRTPDSLERDLCIPFGHADGMYIFDWVSCFKQPPYHLNAALQELWRPEGKWDRIWSVAMKAKRLEPYLVNTEPPRALGMLHSMRSQALELHKADLAGADPGQEALSLPGLYSTRQTGLYSLFRQARVQPDPVYAEGLTAEQLSRYRVLYVQNAVSMTPDEEEMLRAWVGSGGRLIATASTSIMDRWGRGRKDYGLADVFGVRYVETKTLDRAKLAAQPEVTYSGACDVVQPTTGKTALSWPEGTPAVVVNDFGKGRCVFVTARDLGLNYTSESAGPERACFNIYKTYSPGVVAFVRGLVVKEVAAAGGGLPFDAQNCPPEVEVTVRVQQADGVRRRVVHLLNYGYKTPVRGVIVSLPANGEVKAFHPTDGQALECRRADGAVALRVRDFDVYEAIVVEER